MKKFEKQCTQPSGRAVSGLGLLLLTCWDSKFKSCQGHRCLSLMSVVFCQVEVPVSGSSLVPRCPAKCSGSECVHEALIMRRLWPTSGCCTRGRVVKKCIIKSTN